MAPRVPLESFEARRIAFIKPSALGDLMHALPTLEAVRARYPAAEITWVVNRGYRSLVENHPALSDVLPFDRSAFKGGILKSLAAAAAFAKEMRRRRFDLVLDLQGLLRSGLMARFSNAPRRVGLSNAREGSKLCYTDIIPAPGLLEQHAVDRNWLFAEALGVGHLPKKFRLPAFEALHRSLGPSINTYARPLVALAPGARWTTKRWPLEHFASLANRSQKANGGTVVLVGGPEDAAMADAMLKKIAGPAVNLIGRTTLPELAVWLSRVDALVGNDSGPLHLAAALGTPVVAPYTCTRVELHGPFGQQGGIATRVSCHGSYIRTCDRMSCMIDLAPDRLWPALQSALRKWQSTSRSA